MTILLTLHISTVSKSQKQIDLQKSQILTIKLAKIIVMGRIPFYRTSNELEHVHLLVNFEPNRPFTSFTKLLLELTQTSLFQTSNVLERVHLLVIEFEHPIFGFERSNIELLT